MSFKKRFECLVENSEKIVNEKRPPEKKTGFKRAETSNRFNLSMFNTDEAKKNSFTSSNLNSTNFNNNGNYRKYNNYNSFSRTLKKSNHVEKKEKPFEFKNEEFPTLGSN
jgi:hypothetical protein